METSKGVTVAQADLLYLVKVADWAAGQGFCDITGIDDPEEWCLRKWGEAGPPDGAWYSAEALAAALAHTVDATDGEREERLGEALCALSALLKTSGFLDNDTHHAAYERVVHAFRQPAAVADEVGRLREAPCAADVRSLDWPTDVVLPNGGLLFMEGNITSDTHPFSVGALRPDKTLLWEKRYVNFRTARRHFDRCVDVLPRTALNRVDNAEG